MVTEWYSTGQFRKHHKLDAGDEEGFFRLLKVYAERATATGFAFSKDSPWQREFEDAFEFVPTTDQDAAIRDAKRDMESEKPMDRILVGDVGYGKTEVAMRAAMKAVLDGKQVAILARRRHPSTWPP